MRYFAPILALNFLALSLAHAGLPPTKTRVLGESSDVVSFTFRFPNFNATRTGSTLSLGILEVTGGGTGIAALTANNIVVGQGTGAVGFLNPVTAGVNGTLISDGTFWVSTTKATAFNALSPMTTGGDLIYGGASGAGTRLPNGSAGQVLTSAGSTNPPTWTSAGTAPEYVAFRGATTDSACSGTCTLDANSAAVTSVTRNGAGDYTVNFTGGTFSAPPICTCVAQIPGTGVGMCGIGGFNEAASNNAWRFRIALGTTAVNTNGFGQIICTGAR